MKRSRVVGTTLFSIGLALPLIAQSGGAGGRGRAEQRDSVVIRAFGVAKMDTITTIFRALSREQYGSPAWTELSRKLDSLMSSSGQIRLRGTVASAGPREMMPRGWIGFNAQGPNQRIISDAGDVITYFAYPSILSVDPESPADRAGIVPGDVLIALNGTDVVGHEFNFTRMLVPDHKLGVMIRRDGETKNYSLDIAKAPEGVYARRVEFNRMPGPPLPPAPGGFRIEVDKGDGTGRAEAIARRAAARAGGGGGAAGGGGAVLMVPRGGVMAGPLNSGGFMIVTPHGAFGASLSPVGEDLAKVLKLPKGMLVNDVPDQSPASKAGLRAGDVIVNVSGQAVATLGELQDQILTHFGDRSVVLQVMRNKKPAKITVTW